jgi:photosystem II stability/assembly factor-like uncharacterized protein
MKKSASGSTTAAVRRGRQDFIRPAAFVMALAMFVAATLWMHLQSGVPDPLRPVDRFSRQWWLYPIEQNAFMRLPLVSNEPDKLFVLPNSTHAWVGGGESSPVLLHTADRGETWEAITVVPQRLVPSAAASRGLIGARADNLVSASPEAALMAQLTANPQSRSLIHVAAHGEVNPVAKTSDTVEIADFYFADASHGWVLDKSGQILETHDGGKSWTSQRLLGTDYRALAGSGSRLVAGGRGIVSSSTDGGKQWRAATYTTYTNVSITALYIDPDGRIWAGGSNGVVWWSNDASEWMYGGAHFQGLIDRIFFDGPQHGFVEGEYGIMETSDGYRTCKPFVTAKEADTVAFSKSERTGFVRFGAYVVMSMLGGTEIEGGEFSPQIHALEAFGDHKHAIVLGEHGQLFVTADGQSLQRATTPYGVARALYADANAERIWAAGTAGTLLVSDNGGAIWKPRTSLGAQDFRGITFAANGTRGWVAGDNGALVQTDNGGSSWKQVPPDRLSMFGSTDVVVSSDDGMHVRVASHSAKFFRETRDGGITWVSTSVFISRAAFPRVDDVWSALPEPDSFSRFQRFVHGALTASALIATRVTSIAATGENGWARDTSFPTYRSIDGGRTWQSTGAPQDVSIRDVRFLDANHGFAEAENGKKFETNNGGASWQPILNDPSSWSVRPLIANKDGKRMWTASIDGIPLRSLDGGKTWLAPQYRRFPAPWYYLTFAPIAVLLFVSMRKPAPVVRAESSIEDVPWNDRPLTEPGGDRLAYRPLAAGIARFFGNPGTEPPLTIAITGPWGSGKSSLMNLVADAVKRYDYRPVWFNAWHYQSEEFLLPAVLESLRTEAVPLFWTLHGLQFRMRLLVLRGMKNWLPALVIMAVLVTTAAYFMRDHDAFRQLVENFRNLGTEKSDKFFQSAGLVISSLLSIIIVFRSLNAFGVSGTKVAALLSGSVRLADAGGQTGFRHRFARAFGEVTRALGRNRLVLFIDDLDRCRPDHVLSVLECINFLVTSGDCFIIAGIDRPRVERCVAMRFEEESKNIGADENADGENDPVTPVRYAQLYLEKLINIEVPVPLAPPSRSRELFAGDRKEALNERVHATMFGERLIAFGQAAIPWVVGAAVLAGAAYLGYTVLPDRYPHQRPAQTIVVTTPAAAPKSPAVSTPAGTPAQPSPEKQTNLQLPTRFVRPIIAKRPEVLPIIGIVLIVICGIVRLSIERAKLEQDSKDFRTALRQWHPLLYAANATPRSMKRCVNRVRYYAMRQRTNPLPPTLPERLVRFVHRLRRIAPSQDDSPLAIPENILVPVSVVQHVHPEWLEDDAFWRDPAVYIEARQPLPDLADGIAALREHGPIEGYRTAFRHISAGIHVAGTTDGRRIVDPIPGTASLKAKKSD